MQCSGNTVALVNISKKKIKEKGNTGSGEMQSKAKAKAMVFAEAVNSLVVNIEAYIKERKSGKGGIAGIFSSVGFE